MKQIKVNSRCNGCGICIVNCTYLKENDIGNAEYISGKIISDQDLDHVKAVISECPESALELIETGLTNKKGKEGLRDIINALKKQKEEFCVEKVNSNDIDFNVNDYDIPAPYSYKEHRRDYSSKGAAETAIKEELERLCYSPSAYRPILKKVFVEYKVNKLKPYYTCTDTEDSIYFKYNSLMRKKLADIYTEIIYVLDGKKMLPEEWQEFTAFPPKKNDMVEILSKYDENSEQLGIMEAMKNSEYTNLNWYVKNVDIDYDEEYVGDGFWGSKYKKKYYFTGLNDSIKEFIEDLKSKIDDKVFDLNERTEGYVNVALEEYESNVKELLQKKIMQLEEIENELGRS